MMKCAVVGLVKGYSGETHKYEDLINRNIAIHNSFNKFFNYPLLIFHEDNLISSDQKFIVENSPGKINFINISNFFKIDNEQSYLGKINDIERFDFGYRKMCRFNSLYIWELTKQYDYILRVDEDVIIRKISNNFFKIMKQNNLVFLSGKFVEETHNPTNNTLPNEIKKTLGLKSTKFYNHKFPYTNLYAADVKFWLNKEIHSNLKKIVESQNQIINRWGDLAILGCFLNIYASKKTSKKFNKLEYYHGSHKQLVKSNKTKFNFL